MSICQMLCLFLSIGSSVITEPVNILVACGPYTPSDSLTFDPLLDLIHVIARDRPDVCILVQLLLTCPTSCHIRQISSNILFFFQVGAVCGFQAWANWGMFDGYHHLTGNKHMQMWVGGFFPHSFNAFSWIESPGDRDIWGHFLKMYGKYSGWNEKVTCASLIHPLLAVCINSR